jgi:hypothetical protein
MALPSSGAISISNVNSELGAGTNTTRNLGASEVRSLAGMPSGAIKLSNLYGKSSAYVITLVAGQVFPGYDVINGYSSGQNDAAAGSISNNLFKGAVINQITTTAFNGNGIRVYLNGTYSQTFFASVSAYSNAVLVEQKFTSETTQYLVNNNVTSWVWANNFSFANGGTYSIKFT